MSRENTLNTVNLMDCNSKGNSLVNLIEYWDILQVNGESTEGHSHAEVVAMLKGGGQKVRLGLQRGQREHKIRVLLEKGNTGTLGQSPYLTGFDIPRI